MYSQAIARSRFSAGLHYRLFSAAYNSGRWVVDNAGKMQPSVLCAKGNTEKVAMGKHGAPKHGGSTRGSGMGCSSVLGKVAALRCASLTGRREFTLPGVLMCWKWRGALRLQVKNAPAAWQKTINTALAGYLHKFAYMCKGDRVLKMCI